MESFELLEKDLSSVSPLLLVLNTWSTKRKLVMAILQLPIILASVVLACVIYAFQAARVALQSDLRKIPGPLLCAWTFLPLKIAGLRGRRSVYIHSLHQRYGPFVRIAPTEIAVSDLAAFKSIHKFGAEFKKSDFYDRFTADSEPGVFSMRDPKQHGIRRRLFAQALSNTNVMTFEPAIRAKINTAVSKIERDARQGKADVLKWWFFMATDIIGELSFGKSFEMLQKEVKDEYFHDLEIANMLVGLKGDWPFLTKVFGFMPPFSSANKIRAQVDSYGTKAIQNYKSQLLSNPNTKLTLFSRFVDPKRNSELSERTVIAEASNFIIAGSDTTAITMTYLTWALLRPGHHQVRQTLIDEVATLPEDATFSEVSTLPYLKAVVQEALRLYGAAPASLPREVPEGGAQLGDYIIPEKMTVSTQSFTMHRDPTIYHDPET